MSMDILIDITIHMAGWGGGVALSREFLLICSILSAVQQIQFYYKDTKAFTGGIAIAFQGFV